MEWEEKRALTSHVPPQGSMLFSGEIIIWPFCLSFTPKWNQVWLMLATTLPHHPCRSLCSLCNQNNPAPSPNPQNVTSYSPWLVDPSEVLCQELASFCPSSGRSKILGWTRISQEHQGHFDCFKLQHGILGGTS